MRQVLTPGLKTDFFCGNFASFKNRKTRQSNLKIEQKRAKRTAKMRTILRVKMPVAKLSTTPNNEKRMAAFSWCNNPNGEW
jgi:hypothetical protein